MIGTVRGGRRAVPDRHEEPIREAPLVAGLALVIGGALLMRMDPDVLAMPRRRPASERAGERFRRGDRVGAAAQKSRDKVLRAMPSNLLAGVGRAVAMAGAGLLLVRLLDRLAGDR